VKFVTLRSKEGVFLLDWTEINECSKQKPGTRSVLRSRNHIRVCYIINIDLPETPDKKWKGLPDFRIHL
jgi:hypothetical protein